MIDFSLFGRFFLFCFIIFLAMGSAAHLFGRFVSCSIGFVEPPFDDDQEHRM
jgi:hypothetical protein